MHEPDLNLQGVLQQQREGEKAVIRCTWWYVMAAAAAVGIECCGDVLCPDAGLYILLTCR